VKKIKVVKKAREVKEALKEVKEPATEEKKDQ